MEIISGIYRLRNRVNGKVYIGSANNLKYRKRQHFKNLRENKGSPNKKLQRAFNKYGEDSFVFEIIEYVEDKNKLIEREQYCFDTYLFAKKDYKLFDKLSYNVDPTAGSRLGFKTSDETKKLLSKVNKGKVITEEQRQKISETLKGRKHSKERVSQSRSMWAI